MSQAVRTLGGHRDSFRSRGQRERDGMSYARAIGDLDKLRAAGGPIGERSGAGGEKDAGTRY